MEMVPSNDQKPHLGLSASNVNKEDRTISFWSTKRYWLAAALFLGSFTVFSLRANVAISIIEMTKNRTVQINQTIYYEPEFKWNSKIRGLVLSIYPYGYMLSFIGEKIVQKFGGVKTYGLVLFLSGLLNILIPFIVRLNFYLFLFSRALEGFLESVVYISTFEIWSQWSPRKERSKLISMGFTGLYVGTALIFPLCGYLAHIWGWPSTFFVTGGMTVVASSILLLAFGNKPSTDKCISRVERNYLMQELESSPQEKVVYPWKRIFTTKPLWALLVAKFCYGSGYSFINQCLPMYVKDMTNMEIHSVGIFSGIPNVASIVTVPLAGYIADSIQNKNLLNATQVHKIYIFIGSTFGGICLFIIAVGTNFTLNMVFLVFFKILISLNYLTIQLVPLYMAPNHSSLVAAISAYGFFIGGILTPTLIGYVVISHDPLQWSICLTSLGVLLLLGGVQYIFFGSSETQSWSRTRNKQSQGRNTENLLTQECT